jgi:hypothetical protein
MQSGVLPQVAENDSCHRSFLLCLLKLHGCFMPAKI